MVNRRIVISGASRGLGAALARALAAPGVNLLLLARTASDLSKVADCCRAQGACVRVNCLDLRDESAVSQAVAGFAQNQWLNLIIANAGVVSLESWPDENGPDWQQLSSQISDNMACTLTLLGAALRLPPHQRRVLHVVVVSSLNALLPLAEAPGYCVAKAAQKALIETLEDYYSCRRDQNSKLHFTTVFPGFIDTGMATLYPGPRPFQCSAEQAAARILKGVRQKKRRIIFPRRLAILVTIARMLPKGLLRALISSHRAFKDSAP